MDIITYDLNKGGPESNQYYNDALVFTKQVVKEAKVRFGRLVEQRSRENKDECALELLLLGTLWRTYGSAACSVYGAPLKFLAILGEMRRQNRYLKSIADFFRGNLLAFCLTPRNKTSRFGHAPSLTLPGFRKLINWLASTGEFGQEVKRLKPWLSYFAQQPQGIVSEDLARTIDFAAWFEDKSVEALGKYTANVEHFLSAEHPRHRFHEDYIFCGRRRVEYHLNMVGAEIMNQAYRKEFLTKPRQILLLPSCMRTNPGGNCRAVESDLGKKCKGCSSGCQVYGLSTMGEEYGFEVYVVEHESSVFAKGMERLKHEDMAVVGVTCVLNLIAGGWKVKELGIPPQCVLLNYCGCKAHWDERGLVTGINVNRLLLFLGRVNLKS